MYFELRALEYQYFVLKFSFGTPAWTSRSRPNLLDLSFDTVENTQLVRLLDVISSSSRACLFGGAWVSKSSVVSLLSHLVVQSEIVRDGSSNGWGRRYRVTSRVRRHLAQSADRARLHSGYTTLHGLLGFPSRGVHVRHPSCDPPVSSSLRVLLGLPGGSRHHRTANNRLRPRADKTARFYTHYHLPFENKFCCPKFEFP